MESQESLETVIHYSFLLTNWKSDEFAIIVTNMMLTKFMINMMTDIWLIAQQILAESNLPISVLSEWNSKSSHS